MGAQWARAEEARTHDLLLLRVDHVVQMLVDLEKEDRVSKAKIDAQYPTYIFKIMQRASRCRTCTNDVKRRR